MRFRATPVGTRKLIGAGMTFVLATIGIVLVTGTPAQAAAWTCPSHNSAGVPIASCIYPHINGQGSPYLAGFNQGCHNLTGGWNDIASSVRNNRGHGYLFRIWVDANCSGRSWSVVPGGQGNLGAGGGTVYPFPNDKASSWAVYPPGTW